MLVILSVHTITTVAWTWTVAGNILRKWLWIAWCLGKGTFLHHKIAACHKMLHGFRRTQNMWNILSRDVSGAWSGLLKTVTSIDRSSTGFQCGFELAIAIIFFFYGNWNGSHNLGMACFIHKGLI